RARPGTPRRTAGTATGRGVRCHRAARRRGEGARHATGRGDSRVGHSGSFRDAAAWLAATGGTTVGHARATVETSAHLEEFPETEAALRGGELSEVQVNEVVSAARSDPSAERLLLDSAKRDGVRGLKDQCARVRAGACVD